MFDYLIDMRNELEWNPGRRADGEAHRRPVGVGTRYRAKWKQSRHVEVECTEFDHAGGGYVNGGTVSGPSPST